MLNTDSQGFILGELRLKQIKQGVENTEDNTKEILDFLKSEFKRMIDANQSQSDSLNRTIQDYIKQNKKAKDAASQSNSQNTPNNAEPNQNTGNQRGTPNRASSGRSRNADSNAPSTRPRPSRDAEDPNPNPTRRTRTRSQAEERAQLERERSNQDRDSKGRFTAKDKTILEKFKDLFKNGGGSSGNVDTKGYDPTVDALNELKEIVSPVGNIFGKMTSRAIGILRGRMRKNRNEQTLPEEQQQANRREQESDKERNKLLKRLIDAVRSNGGGGGGLFGGLLGKLFKGGKGLFKGLLKRVPLLGLLFGGASLFSEWGKLDSGGKGKGIGSLAGGALGAILGSVFGPLGTIGGGALGAYLGGIFGKKVGEWTDTLKNSDFVGIFKSLWSDAIGKIVDIAESIKNSKIVKNTKEAIGNGIDYVKQGASNLYNKVTGNKSKGNAASGGSGVSGVDLLSYGQGGGSSSGLKDEGTNGLGIYKPIADAVAKYESKGSYTIANTGGYEKRRVKGDFKTINEANLTNMSINDILKRNALPVGDPKRLNAVGRYQIIASNLRNWVADGSLKGTDIFTPELQDKLFLKLLPKSAKDYAKGKNVSIAKVQNDIAGQWAAVPRADTGRSAHENTGLNKANPKAGGLVVEAMNQIRSGKSVEQPPIVQTNTKGKDVIPLPQQAVGQNKSKMVTPKSSKDLATFAQNAEMPISSKILNPNVTPKTKSILQMNRMQSSNITKVQPIAAERVPLSTGNKVPVMTAQAQDSNINQNVSDRGLAHIFSGGIGFKTLQG
ncbi:hypothetical protein DJ533_00060 (plasmid) [Acinetobacter defluvii]|uniref:Glycine zipper domain-containing protein n=1 Tax=Acinetobacter defluvii TaxID=1871111 RepID=A0A2S2F823_9GAMM|nr:hypothetical protein [Acinetobacter defluvii]AWL27113.1 hypothetical protein DJ533_00060 [Acinetobacter defluvii]